MVVTNCYLLSLGILRIVYCILMVLIRVFTKGGKTQSRDETHLLRWVLTESTFTLKGPGRGDGVVSRSVVGYSV